MPRTRCSVRIPEPIYPMTDEERAALAQQLLEEDTKSLAGMI